MSAALGPRVRAESAVRGKREREVKQEVVEEVRGESERRGWGKWEGMKMPKGSGRRRMRREEGSASSGGTSGGCSALFIL
jgi:hypothetical protein